jgi:uncharacterized protein YqgV (UPF0045/DUF77 family)
MKAQEFAEKVAAFIHHNNIDTTTVPMDTIVEQYFASQLRAISQAGEACKARIPYLA